jgi:exodeoxyribonuclease VII small subunit
MSKELSYNEALTEMEQIMQEIESEDVAIDKLSSKVKRLAVLIKQCKTQLHTTEEEVQSIIDDIQ